ncbi:S-adenosyl-L-methionine-dependent methyltransferase [Talaromyces proteolyticus]|uniref:S-adenosyl-L-methionine-dependent methyltransferase n=1 Tax=Talaromyces proteolyticus TaxID=1131652 RepID=A0AAD4L4I8_9EURO|nr:S-adenosyl-L-methionine-dependent methyltransferase [Talaromyces proteolyticus]KAH8704881.1 S-adenosyl-L-methionine-dependent methyltransferase [Talaromyces proteolyticus]
MAMTPDDSSGDRDTQSLTDSVTDYPKEYGRTYHRYHEGLYPYPNDEQELDRLDMLHHIWKEVNQSRLYISPLREPKHILDIGTGSGIWPIEMATIFPDATITGTDLSPVQPTEVPPNVHFLVEDATENEWLWEANHFDYIRLGNMSGALPSVADIMRKVMKVLKPGGWFEWHEIDPTPRCEDGTMPPPEEEGFSQYALHDWVELSERAATEIVPTREFIIAPTLAHKMRSAGFVNVDDQSIKVPMNRWPRDPQLKTWGEWYERNWLDGLSAFSYKPLQSLGWSKPEIEVFLVSVRQCISNRHFHTYHNFHIVTGRKPFPGE